MRIPPVTAALLLTSTLVAVAQVSVEVVLDQDQFLRDESLPVKVRITNRSGQLLRLGRDNEWLAFVIETGDGRPVSRMIEVPVTGEFVLESARMATREVDLGPCFDLSEPGHYTIGATVKIK